MDDVPKEDGPVQEQQKVEDISKEALGLPKGFEWVEVNLENEQEITDVYSLLRDHYVEDSEGIFRFEYPIEFLKWILCAPGYKKEWHIGVRSTEG